MSRGDGKKYLDLMLGVAGGCLLCSQTLDKLRFDSEDGVHTQLTRINHGGFCFWQTQMWRGDTARKELGLGASLAFLDFGTAERRLSWAFLRCFLHLPGCHPAI